MKPGTKVNTPHGTGILMTRCERGDPAWWVLYGTVARMVAVEDIEVMEE